MTTMREQVASIERAVAPQGDGVFAFDRERRYVHWNPAMEGIFGMSAAEVLGRQVTEVFPFLAASGELVRFDAALRGEGGAAHDCAFEVEHSRRSGWYDAFYSAVVDLEDGGAIVGGVAIVRDMTAARRSRQQVLETEERFKNMADASPVMLWMAGADSLCTFFNATWLAFTRRSLAEEWGVGWVEGVYFEDVQACMDTYIAAFNERRAFEMEYRLRRHDGEYRWILDRGAPRYLPDGSFAGYIGSCTDIHDRKRLEDELRLAVRARDEFLAIAAHELRTPLTPIRLGVEGALKKVRRGDSDRPAVVRKLEQLEALVERQVALVENLLEVSRVAGGLMLSPEDLDAADIVSSVIGEFAAEASVGGTELRARVVPAPGCWDRTRLEQIVRNVVSNAIKYGKGRPVDVALAPCGADAIAISVADHGIGIAPEDTARIFERFERAAAPRHLGGLGLGLWIARNLVEAMGGKISVASRRGEGSTFTIELPRALAVASQDPAPAAGVR